MKNSFLLFLVFLVSISMSSCSNDDDTVAPNEQQTNLIGIWNGNLKDSFYNENTGYPNGINFTIDVKQQLIIADGNVPGDYIIGKIYFSDTITSCCGQENDGQITAQYFDDGKLSNAVIQQTSSINNIICQGILTGTGLFTSNTMTINFIGTDCEGFHTGGEIQLTKSN
ncbi:hypothetical protein [uncultured Psychroserpens sp.]|uniref:hypothetical protein n=1 Tax=uncultured Psychroserpens sp. TaxID=255436 RepID=UPI0026037B0D|nr:hypothetical protein [uncultured Psychroserpens sp.]